MIGIKHFHPKFSPAGGDSLTTIWGDGVKADVANGELEDRDPDGPFGGGVAAYCNLVTGNILIAQNADDDDDAYQQTIAHEIGHATRRARTDGTVIHRALFGPGDHSAARGLMASPISEPEFSDEEKRILRGIKPDAN